jgi:hypothetical protein
VLKFDAYELEWGLGLCTHHHHLVEASMQQGQQWQQVQQQAVRQWSKHC